MRGQTMEIPVAALLALALLLVATAGGLVAVALRHGARLRQIESARNDVLDRLALVAEFRDHGTREHGRRVARTAGRIAEGMGLPAEEAREIARAAGFHDIGMVGVPDAVLSATAPLSAEERAVAESHTLIGAEILAGEPGLLALAAEIALSHHEHWDGTGYPHGLRGSEIPLAARIVAVADEFHGRVRPGADGPARPVEIAVAEIERLAGSRFDPAVVDAFGGLPHHDLARARQGAP